MFRALTRTQLAVDVSVAGVFVLVVLPFDLSIGRFSEHNALGTVLVAVFMGTALGLRRAAPGLALTVAWAGAVVQMVMARPPSMADVAIFGVLYGTAAYGSRRTFWAGLVSTAVGAAVITGYLFVPVVIHAELSGSTITTALAVALAAVFGLGLAWTIGALVRTGIRAREHRRAQQRAEEVALAEAERTAIARDMHDVVAHSLAVVIAQADGARYAAVTNPDAAIEALATISGAARAALADVRLLLTQLRHAQSEGPQPTLADLEQLYAHVRATGVELRVDVDPTPVIDPPAAVQLAVYRILQEALTNALRHGAPTAIDVRLGWHAGHVDLEVRNAIAPAPGGGGGGAASDIAERRGHGIIGMTERAGLVGGWLRTRVTDGGEFVVTAWLPIAAVAGRKDSV